MYPCSRVDAYQEWRPCRQEVGRYCRGYTLVRHLSHGILLLKSVNEWTEYHCDNSTCANNVDRKIYYETLLSNAVIQTGQVGTHNTALLESSTQVTKED